jgi:hypothetical protein
MGQQIYLLHTPTPKESFMRYLIFNITVLAALGYLITGGPNQSFTQWAAAKLDVWGTQPATVKPADQGVIETGTIFAKAVAKATSEKLETIDPEAFDEEVMVSDVAVGDEPSGQPTNSTSAPEMRAPLDKNEIKKLVLAALSEAQLEAEAEAKAEAEAEAERTMAATQNTPALVAVSEPASVPASKPVEKPMGSTEMSDAQIEAAFKAFEKPQNDRPNTSMVANSDGGSKLVKVDGFVEQVPAFMSRADRAADMSKIIQQLNILYLEKAGI